MRRYLIGHVVAPTTIQLSASDGPDYRVVETLDDAKASLHGLITFLDCSLEPYLVVPAKGVLVSHNDLTMLVRDMIDAAGLGQDEYASALIEYAIAQPGAKISDNPLAIANGETYVSPTLASRGLTQLFQQVLSGRRLSLNARPHQETLGL